MDTSRTLRQTRIVRSNGRLGIHWVDVCPKTSAVLRIEQTPIVLSLPADGTRTQYLELVELIADAMSAHRHATITLDGKFAMPREKELV